MHGKRLDLASQHSQTLARDHRPYIRYHHVGKYLIDEPVVADIPRVRNMFHAQPIIIICQMFWKTNYI